MIVHTYLQSGTKEAEADYTRIPVSSKIVYHMTRFVIPDLGDRGRRLLRVLGRLYHIEGENPLLVSSDHTHKQWYGMLEIPSPPPQNNNRIKSKLAAVEHAQQGGGGGRREKQADLGVPGQPGLQRKFQDSSGHTRETVSQKISQTNKS